MSVQVRQPVPFVFGAQQFKGTPVFIDWTDGSTEATIDFVLFQALDRIKPIQSAFIDNSANDGGIVVRVINTSQSLAVPAGAQAYFPFIGGDRSTFLVTTTGAVNTNIVFTDAPLPPYIWSANSVTPIIANPLPVTDAALEALISSGRFNVRNIDAQTTAADFSGQIAVGGVAQTLVNASATRRGILIQNTDETNLEDIWFNPTGAAVIGGAGSFSLAAAGGAGYPGGIYQGTLSNAFSIIAATTGHKFSCITW